MALIETTTTDGCSLNHHHHHHQQQQQPAACGRKPGFYGRRPGSSRSAVRMLQAGELQDLQDHHRHPYPSTEGLPRAFLHSLRTLFDILDDGRRGFVHISEIESRWQGSPEEGSQEEVEEESRGQGQGLPRGVLAGLRRVAPPHGCLTFDRFVAGLRHSMLNPENHNRGHSMGPQTQQHQQQSLKPYPKHQSQTQHLHHQPPPPAGLQTRLAFNLRQMKELEQEKDSLLAGLELVDRAREWYQTQIHNDSLLAGLELVDRAREWYQTQIHNPPVSSTQPPSTQVPPQAPPQAIQRLKDQNRLLTQLFEARANTVHDASAMDSTFI
ncbi:hypothetical protein CRUP_004925 [Coryphaenoides rupestris]|nr:hypothetical protein CRUP_004925 [Coryphaenoides rupestris]